MLLCVFCHFIRPHHGTTYIDAAYSYRPSSVVCRSVCHTSDPAKTTAPIELPFGLRTWVGPGNNVLDGGPGPPMGRGKCLGENGIPLSSIGTLYGRLCKDG